MHRYDSGDRAAVDVEAIAEELAARSQTLLEPFRAQAFAIRSVVVASADSEHRLSRGAVVFQTGDDGTARRQGSGSPSIVSKSDAEGENALEHLSRRARELCGAAGGGDLLVAPAEALAAMTGSAGAATSFRAVAAIMPRTAARRLADLDRALRRGLFDDGLVPIGSVELASRTLLLFLASDAVHVKERLGSGGRDRITMSSLGSNGRFANQLFQYAFLKLYALRHGTGIAVPDWPGRTLFGIDDPDSAGIELPELLFKGFSDEHLELWRAANPPVDVDFWGYFQEIPSCWRPHRQLLRTLFELPAAARNALDGWRGEATANGRRTLVAIHLRRTDYRLSDLPWFRIIPEKWYLDWLRKIWPTLTDPVLFVATDEPDTVLPHFAEFSPRSSFDLAGIGLPDHVRDFEMLRRADCLAICNSSFSRMAAILAPETQRCFVPSVAGQRIVPYDPWGDSAFWPRFGDAAGDGPDRAPAQPGRKPGAASGASLYLDVTDLLFHLRSHATLTGIQRVQCELVCNLSAQTPFSKIHFTVFGQNGLAEIAKTDLLEILERVRLGSAASPALRGRLRTLLAEATPAEVQAGDVLFMTGAYWAVGGIGRFVQRLKNEGLTVGIFVHDILPISRPEYFQANAGAALARPVAEALALADFLVTSSSYNRDALATYYAGRGLDPVPIRVVPLGHALPKPSGGGTEIGPELAALLESEFVLCVGTIEIRKNPSYLLNVWKLMVDAGREAIPTLVFAGHRGWLVDGFFEQLRACDRLDGKIVLLHDLPDRTLDLLYRRCLLTMFPSFEEGWGLPVGESLSYGKVCLASRTGGIPEAGGEFADYIDPYNVRDGYDLLVRYLDDPALRLRREREIADRFAPRSWLSYAEGIVSSVKEEVKRPSKVSVITAISLPANEFLPIGSAVAGTSRKAVEGFFSAESACISGWGALDAEGIPAGGPVSILRFRTGPAQGSKVTLVFRLSASRLGPCRLRIRSGGEGGQTVKVGRGRDRTATLICESGADGLVTLTFERMDVGRFLPAGLCPWKLKGFLYIQPGNLARPSPEPMTKSGGRRFLDTTLAQAGARIAPSEAAARDVGSLTAFLQTPDARWPAATKATLRRRAPVFADAEDRRLFLSRYRNSRRARLGMVPDDITFRRLGNPYVSTSRFTEGSIFDASGVVKDFGFLQLETGRDEADWLARGDAGAHVRDEALAQAPYLNGTFAVFFNGNLHNYYHWVAEGLLALDVLIHTIGDGLDLKIVLPKTMDINAAFDHRASLAALGFDRWPIVEAPPPIARLGEAVWVESGDFMEGVPAAQVLRFQQRIASLYAGRRGPRNRRLLVKRLGQARAIGNLAEVESFLHPLGFETVQLEGTSIEEQVTMFQRAEFVVGAHGAGLTNLLFCEPGTKIIEFMPTVEMRPFFWLISEKLGLRHAMQFCPGIEGVGFQASIHVDIDKLRRLYELIEGR